MDSIIKATNTTLSKYNKSTTPPTIFHQLFRTLKSSYPNHNFVFTDGSKSGGITTYSITTETATIKLGLLPFYSSVLSSEIIAIQEAIKIYVKMPGKHRLPLLHLLDHQSLQPFVLCHLSQKPSYQTLPKNLS